VYLLWSLGRFEEALRQLRIAEKNDPLSPQVQFNLGWSLISAGRYVEAEEHCNKLPTDHLSKNMCLGRALVGQAKTEEAIRILTKSNLRSERAFWATLMRSPVAEKRLRHWQWISRQSNNR
jgi:tetratricopeptide (TPR) repeat protein